MTAGEAPIADTLRGIDWRAIEASLDAEGWARIPGLLRAAACEGLARLYGPNPCFRSHVVMARHGFGMGEYRYFSYPLPEPVSMLRSGFYAGLAPIANAWRRRLGGEEPFPETLAAYLDRCHRAGQRRPTPLLLRYAAGDYNRLHQDLYGQEAFPLQATILLSRPGLDFTGGEFVLTEQRPRMQSRAMVVPLEQGDAVLFAVHRRPGAGARGDYRVTMRHGVSKVHAGQRYALGIIMHDAN